MSLLHPVVVSRSRSVSPSPPSRSPSPSSSLPPLPHPSSSRFLVVRERRPSGRDARADWGVMLARTAADVLNLLQFTPAAVAATLLSAVMQTISTVRSNHHRCIRIGQRAARALTDLGWQMEGKWDRAPQSLLNNIASLESTLLVIRDFMVHLSQARWHKRLISKAQIEDSLQACEQQLDDALQAFQFSSSIEIHFAVGSQQAFAVSVAGPSRPSSALTLPSRTSTPPLPETPLPDADADEEAEFLASLTELEDEFGFRRYHQSEVVLSKPHARRNGWFSTISDGSANGTKVAVKRYDGPQQAAVKQWIKDVKLLRNLYHDHIPQLLGYSNGKTPTPFIILASAPKQDVVSYLHASWTPEINLVDGTLAFLKAYRDIACAMLYVQQQLALDNQQTKDFIHNASYAVDSNHNIILGLPLHVEDTIVRRRWTELVGAATLRRSIIYNYLTFLERIAGDVLTRDGIRAAITESLCLVEDIVKVDFPDILLRNDIEETLSMSGPIKLSALRDIAGADADGGRSSIMTRMGPLPFAFDLYDLGDIGYGSFSESPGTFERVGNIFELEHEACLEVEYVDDIFTRASSDHPASDSWMSGTGLKFAVDYLQENETASLRCKRFVSPDDAWMYLKKWAKPLAAQAGVEPQDIMIIIRLGGPMPTTADTEPDLPELVVTEDDPQVLSALTQPRVEAQPVGNDVVSGPPVFETGYLKLTLEDCLELAELDI